MRRKVVPLLALLLLAPAAPAAAQTGAPAAARTGAPAKAPAGSIAWGPCDPAEEAPARVLCGTLDVPIDWSKPRGPKLTLALAKLPAADPAQRIGSLLINPGGPGGSGVGFAFAAGEAFSPAIVNRFDIIGFDPRGQARSQAILCDSDDLAAQSEVAFPDSAAEYAQLRAANRELFAGCAELSGPLFKFVDTASVARDMDAIRAGLGESKISYYGVSYGTMIGQQYAELFPTRVRAMALDSNMDHSQNIPDYQKYETLAMEGSFVEFAKWCERTEACVLNDENVLAYFDELYAQAEAGDLVFEGEPVAPETLISAVFGYLYDPISWFELATLLAALGGDATDGRLGRGEPVVNGYLPVMCSDFRFDVGSYRNLAALERAQNRLAPHTKLSPIAWTDLTSCQNWPYRVSNPPHRLRASSKLPPILLANSRWDVATPYEWGRSLARQLPSSTFLTYDGVGHGTYWLSPCAQAAIDTYLVERRTPAKGTHCPAVFPTTPPQAATLSSTGLVNPLPQLVGTNAR
ncbi:alpha/beta hydrolase [Actinoplanes sp. NBC_00393]|uniref:alpha/beta hydrolase n=1 Tax=Actinoplanes sp. NBC_00393 TaxID=2975953 RepID=UPI002E1F305E